MKLKVINLLYLLPAFSSRLDVRAAVINEIILGKETKHKISSLFAKKKKKTLLVMIALFPKVRLRPESFLHGILGVTYFGHQLIPKHEGDYS